MVEPTEQQPPPPAPPAKLLPADRLTQIQDCVSKVGEMFFIAAGVTQRDAPLVALNSAAPVTAWTDEQIKANNQSIKALAADVSVDLVQTCKVIDFLVDQLPGLHESEEMQLENLKALEAQSDEAGVEMDAWIAKAEAKLADVKAALQFIAEDQFEYLSLQNKT
ncbi:hypothetical protein BJ741DRAFT_588288, partial [Chytriomyces cf. hyalinus JEL632]